MSIYQGVDGVNRELKKIYQGVDGVNRQLKERWEGVDGVNRKVFSTALAAEIVRDAPEAKAVIPAPPYTTTNPIILEMVPIEPASTYVQIRFPIITLNPSDRIELTYSVVSKNSGWKYYCDLQVLEPNGAWSAGSAFPISGNLAIDTVGYTVSTGNPITLNIRVTRGTYPTDRIVKLHGIKINGVVIY